MTKICILIQVLGAMYYEKEKTPFQTQLAETGRKKPAAAATRTMNSSKRIKTGVILVYITIHTCGEIVSFCVLQ